MAERLDILDGGTIYYDAAFYRKDEADALFETLRTETPWRQERGRFGPFPRLTAWYADPDCTYSYSGVTHEPLPWTPTLAEIRRQVREANATLYNSVLLNFYRDGRDSMGFHADNEPELCVNPIIASVSLGAARQFVLKHVQTGEKLKFDLTHGSLLVMAGSCQHYWVHGVPKAKADVGPRINLTFRNIVAPSGQP